MFTPWRRTLSDVDLYYTGTCESRHVGGDDWGIQSPRLCKSQQVGNDDEKHIRIHGYARLGKWAATMEHILDDWASVIMRAVDKTHLSSKAM